MNLAGPYALSGDGSSVVTGVTVSALVFHVTAFGQSYAMDTGDYPRLSKVGWVALGDQVDGLLSLGSTQYAVGREVWLGVEWGLYRIAAHLPNFVTEVLAPDLLVWHLKGGATADLWLLDET